MARWYGKVGYAITEDSGNGVWTENIVEKYYYGDVQKPRTSWQQNSNSINDNIRVTCQISILADPYAYHYFVYMRWVEYMGQKWKIESVENMEGPRLLLNVGGLYEEQN